MTEMWLWILDRVESIKLYVDDEEFLFHAEIYYRRDKDRPDLRPDFTHESGYSWEELVEKVYSWMKE